VWRVARGVLCRTWSNPDTGPGQLVSLTVLCSMSAADKQYYGLQTATASLGAAAYQEAWRCVCGAGGAGGMRPASRAASRLDQLPWQEVCFMTLDCISRRQRHWGLAVRAGAGCCALLMQTFCVSGASCTAGLYPFLKSPTSWRRGSCHAYRYCHDPRQLHSKTLQLSCGLCGITC
jgi:hypothetical protein